MSIDVFERLDLSRAQAALGVERWAEGRALLLAALRAARLDVGKRPELDDAALGSAPPHWLLLFGRSMANGYGLYLVPESLLDAEARAWLDACDRAILNFETAFDAPEVYRAFRLAEACVGRDQWLDFGRFEARQPEDRRLGEAAYRALVGRWPGCAVSPKSKTNCAKLDTRITRVVHVFEHL